MITEQELDHLQYLLDILEALKRRDSPGARAAMRKHFTRLIDALLKESEEQAYKELTNDLG